VPRAARSERKKRKKKENKKKKNSKRVRLFPLLCFSSPSRCPCRIVDSHELLVRPLMPLTIYLAINTLALVRLRDRTDSRKIAEGGRTGRKRREKRK
jgi:hypothetical protein